MNYIIRINGYQLELDRDVNFERTIQRNTIGNLADRQSTYTSTIKVYKTGKNYQFFEFLDQPGVNSDLPYIVLRAEILNEAGMIVNKKGRAFIEKTDKDYFYLNIYDGFIDFLKKIENKTLDDLNLAQLNHDKSINSVIDSWNDNEKYIYLISDFNGNNLHNGKLNIDYQLPSASIKYIWDKIFDFTGYTYNSKGVFNTNDFNDLYISYPKPISSDVQVVPVLEQKNNFQYVLPQGALDVLNLPYDIRHPWMLPTFEDNQYFLNEPKTGPEIQNSSQRPAANVGDHLFPPNGMFKKSGIYRLSVSGKFYIEDPGVSTTVSSNVYYKVLNSDYDTLQSGKIGTLGNVETSVDLQVVQGNYLSIYVLNEFTDTGNDIQDQSTSTFTFRIHDKGGDLNFLTSHNGETNLGITTKLEYFDSQSVYFANVFGKIKIRDFLNDMMFRFGLTPFPDHKRKHIDFLLQEDVFLSDVVDYSNKFIREEETRFAYNDYAQKNYFRYEYNDKEANHNDGAINVNNENIQFEKELYNSFFYSPGKGKSEILGNELLKSKTWDRKIDQDSNVEYEELDGRYYIFKKELINQSINLSSVELGNSGSSSTFYKASFSQLDYESILNGSYYRFTDKVIKKSKVRNVILYLSDLEFMNVDVKKRMYLKQYSSNFLINRIKDRSGESEYNFELLEINYNVKNLKNEPPEIILVGNNISIVEGDNYIEPGYSAYDNNGKDITSKVVVTSNINNQIPGNYVVTYQVEDNYGLTDSKIRNVSVKQNQAPVITLTGGDVTITEGDSLSLPGYLATDNEDGDLTNQVVIDNQVDRFTPGTYTITYTVTDSGGLTDTKTRTVIVESAPVNQAPVITLTGGSVEITEGETYNEPGYTASDNEDGKITNQVQVTNDIDNQTPGNYTVTYTVTDSGGLTDTKTRSVTVVQSGTFTLEEFNSNAAEPYLITFSQTGLNGSNDFPTVSLDLLPLASNYSVTIEDQDSNGNTISTPSWLEFIIQNPVDTNQHIQISPNSNNDTGSKRTAYKLVKDNNSNYQQLVTVEQVTDGGSGIS